jgi:hypothetical protein
MCPAGPLSGRQAQAALRASTTSFLAEGPRGRRSAHQITRSGVSWRRASCTRCAVSKPSRSSGISRCPPSARPAWIATLITFGSISAVVLRVHAARSKMARWRVWPRARAEAAAPMTAINKKTPAMARPPKGSPTGSTATRIPSRTKKQTRTRLHRRRRPAKS